MTRFQDLPPGRQRTANEMSERMRNLTQEDHEPDTPAPGEPDTRTRSQVYADQLRERMNRHLRENPPHIFKIWTPEERESFRESMRASQAKKAMEAKRKRRKRVTALLVLLAVLALISIAWVSH